MLPRLVPLLLLVIAIVFTMLFAASDAHAAWPFDGITGLTDTSKKEEPPAAKPAAPSAITVPKAPTAPTKPVVPSPAAPAKQAAPAAIELKKDSAPAAPITLPAKPAAVEVKKGTAPATKTEAPKTTEPAKTETPKVAEPAKVAEPVRTEAPKTDPAKIDPAAAALAAQAKADAEKKEAALKAHNEEQRIAAEKAKAEADAKAKLDAENAKVAAEKAKAEADSAKAAEEKQKAEAARLEQVQKKKDAATIMGHLENKGEFKVLIELFALAKINTLKSPGNYTIFAPTDSAFSKFSGIKMEDLKNPAYIDQLKNLLSFHMLNGNFLMKNVTGTKAAPNALQGDILDIDATTEPVKVGKSTIKETDTGATNGTIYVLDAVMLPPNLLAQLSEAKAQKAKEDAATQ